MNTKVIFKLSLIIVLIVLITVLFYYFSVSAEEEYIIKPSSVNWYSDVYSVTPGGGSFFDPTKNYKSFFSPYATSQVIVESNFYISGAISISYESIIGELSESLIDSLKKSLQSYFYLENHNGTGDYQYNINLYQLSFDYDSKYFVAWFTITYNSILSIDSGTLGFYHVTDYDYWGPTFRVGFKLYEHNFLFIDGLKSESFSVQSFSMNSKYKLPIVCTSDNLLLSFRSGITGTESSSIVDYYISDLFLNGIKIDSRKTTGIIGGVYDINYLSKLNNSVFDFTLTTNSNGWYPLSNNDQGALIYFFEFGTLIPYSLNQGYSGGINYGSWSSNSCEWYDIPCHLGNALGYFIYEFPLTKPLTNLVGSLIGYLEVMFNFSAEFEAVEVVYGVFMTMIVVGFIVMLFK